MKRIIKTALYIVLTLVLSISFMACDNATEEQSGADDGQNPIMNFIGKYGNNRATILVEAEGSDGAKFTVTWSSSAAENSEWVMSGTFDDQTLKVQYDNCVKTNYVYAENGEITSQEEQYTDGHGVIQFIEGEELALTWQDDQENIANDVTFTYASYGGDDSQDLAADSTQMEVPESLSHDGYTLEKVVVLSRHNIRSPLSDGDSVLGKITPYEWFDWSSPASQLSVRGGTLETGMGQYFRKWLEDEGLFPENYLPDKDDVRIYANSKQRTIATARFFAAGLMPVADEDVEYHADFDAMDPVFNPQLTFVSDEYVKAAKKQISEMYEDEIEGLKDNYDLISDVIDMKDSEAYKDGSVEPFRTDDTEIILEKDAEPAMEGSLKTACSVSDAMTLQYYEEEDPVKAAFGNDLSEKQWDEIAEIKDIYGDVLFTAPLISCNVANPLLKEMQSEISNEKRLFTFMCGHDSNLASVLSALGAEEYALPETIEKKTPIGVKLVFTNWKGKDEEEYWDVDLVYQTTDQLRDVDILTEKDHPASVDVSFKGIQPNEEGLFTEKELKNLFEHAIGEYKEIMSEYGQN